jgi:hypothetical protein
MEEEILVNMQFQNNVIIDSSVRSEPTISDTEGPNHRRAPQKSARTSDAQNCI